MATLLVAGAAMLQLTSGANAVGTARSDAQASLLKGLAAVVLLMVVSCLACPYTRSRVVGRYQLKYDEQRIEYLTLRADGTFEQRFGSARNNGSWQYMTDSRGGYVLLHQQQIFVATRSLDVGPVQGNLSVQRTDHGPELELRVDLREARRLDFRTVASELFASGSVLGASEVSSRGFCEPRCLIDSTWP